MCPNSSLSEEEPPEYPSSDVIQDLLSSLPPLPAALLLQLHDAHCHPTDHPHTLSQIDTTASGSLCAMSTRPDDQSLVESFAADNLDTVVPFFGYHPWFAHLFSIDDENHYESIFKPTPSQDFIAHLPKPIPWDRALKDLRERLETNPKAQVGEIGLDKSFRLPTHINGQRDVAARKDLSPYRTTPTHQLCIFTDQCRLAAQLGRSISVHGVQCHGTLFTTLQSLWHPTPKNTPTQAPAYPPRICIHSASLPIDTLKQYLHASVPAKVYFSFSTVINARYGQKLLDLIAAVPADKILIESDWHSEGSIRRSQLVDMARLVIHVKQWTAEQGVKQLEQNFRDFVHGNDQR